MKIIEVSNLMINLKNRILFQNVNFSVNSGEIVAIVGDNGVGKTTLIQALMGRRKSEMGTVKWNLDLQKQIRYIPQYREDIEDFPLDIKSFVELSFDSGILPWLSKSEKKTLDEVLRATDLNKIADSRIDKASGGEKQRAYLAQALISNPKCLILDEATANLDNISKYKLMDLIKKFSEANNLGVIMVSHDLKIVKKYADKYLYIHNQTSEFGKIDNLNIEDLEIGENDHA